MMKALLFLFQFVFVFVFALTEAKSFGPQPHAAESFNISYIQVRWKCFIPKIDPFWFGLSIKISFDLKFTFSFVCSSFGIPKECGKLFLHGCHNDKLFFNKVHERSDQYFIRWRLWQSGSIFVSTIFFKILRFNLFFLGVLEKKKRKKTHKKMSIFLFAG